MPPRISEQARLRAVRAVGFLGLVALVAWASSRFLDRPIWPGSARQVLAIAAWAGGLQVVLRVTEGLARPGGQPSLAGYGRVYALTLISCATFAWYFNAERVGPLDAQWYENMTTDYLAQARAGTFPVLAGSTLYAFNGAVHPFRSAPWQFVLADGVDIASGRSLAPVAVEHVTAIASFLAAVLVLYAGLSRSRPRDARLAWLFALAYATSPAATVPFFRYDMYMTLTAQPVMLAALLCVQRAVDEDSAASLGWLGALTAALWYCHPPMALVTGLVAWACVGAAFAVKGLTVGRAAGAALGAGVFALLAAPYFRSMSELAQAETTPLATFAMPAAGLALCLFAMAGFLRTGLIPWLALLPTGILCLHAFEPSLVPFAACFAAAMAMARALTRSRSRDHDGAWTAVCALAAAATAVLAFPGILSPPVPGGWATSGLRPLLEPIGSSGIFVQPGYLSWAILVGMATTCFISRSLFVQLATAAGALLVVATGVCGRLSQFLWHNTPDDVIRVISVGYHLRLLPILAVVIVTGGFYWLGSLRADHPRAARAACAVILLLVPWALWQHGQLLYDTRNFHIGIRETAYRNRSENVALERYSWDLLAPPRFINWGVMDPVLETRFWSDSDLSAPRIDPDSLERSLERAGQPAIPVTASTIPTGRSWLSLSPTIELDPGQRVLLRFDFLGNCPAGTLVVRGQTIYREYQLPSSGRDYAFGFNPGNTHTLSLWNSGAAHESVQLLIARSGPDMPDPPATGPYWLLHITPYDPARAPIELYSLTPLHLRVEAPTPGYVETFRSLVPGYSVQVDGKPAVVHASRNALVSVRVNAGRHDLIVRFVGTRTLRSAVLWAEIAWAAAALAAVAQVGAMLRRGRPATG